MLQRLIQNKLLKALSYGRLGLYTLESLPIIKARRDMGLISQPKPKPPENHLEILQQTLGLLIEQDVQNIERGIYTAEALSPENPISHLYRYIKIYSDSLEAAKRVKSRQHKKFSQDTKPLLDELPDYYKRNFHNQTDGYLSETSADLYAHQIEILFKGSMGLMRRILLADLINYIKSRKHKVSLLELGCGMGDSTELLLNNCPNLEITAIDLSRPYLEKAKVLLKNHNNVNLHFAAAENFKTDKKFDIIFSSFLFHEIPLNVRQKIFDHISQYAKVHSKWVHIDSLQLGDRKEFDWALIQFPKDFHEPYYKSYSQNSLESDLPEGFKLEKSQQAFLSKSIWLSKE